MATTRDFELLNSGMDSLTRTLLQKDMMRQQKEERAASQKTADERTRLVDERDRERLALDREVIGMRRQEMSDRRERELAQDAERGAEQYGAEQQAQTAAAVKQLDTAWDSLVEAYNARQISKDALKAQAGQIAQKARQMTEAVLRKSKLAAFLDDADNLVDMAPAETGRTPARTAEEMSAGRKESAWLAVMQEDVKATREEVAAAEAALASAQALKDPTKVERAKSALAAAKARAAEAWQALKEEVGKGGVQSGASGAAAAPPASAEPADRWQPTTAASAAPPATGTPQDAVARMTGAAQDSGVRDGGENAVVELINPAGKRVGVKARQVEAALQQGYRKP